ncbi:glycosyltransferase family 4 protein [Carboxylicivirga linearis]|uniref:Glycosyltransferase family 4 protein n=1 Tax=Carboxylicivirga linearis TaxID=1628157 RepID=A0ABS5JWF7_9BACT|nr:glycosyltransferase family 4 protein [Carboxylicivirga linearis]MBS2099110.1 glycosyltransferase family 4 protein [Carboxylicivirga linearis]
MGNAPQSSICFVIPRYVTFSTGGAEIQVYYLVNEFLRRGWKVEVLCAGKGKEEEIKNSPYFDARIHYHYYSYKTFRFLEFFSALFLLFKTQSDIYYQRTDFALTAACAYYCRLRKRKMVYAMAHDKDAEKGKYIREFKQFTYQSKFKQILRKLDFLLVDRMVEWGKRKANFILAQNIYQKEQFEDSFYRTPTIIPSSYQNNISDSIEKENIVLWVANMTSDKQPELFYQVVNKLQTTKGWRFVMVGKKSKELVRNENSIVEIKGELSYSDTLEWFKKAKIFINTSSAEGMPNTFIQAWFNKVLVLSLKVDPNFLLREKQLGYVFNNEIDALVDFLNRLIAYDMDIAEILDKAYSYASETFDVRRNVDKLITLIQN